mmetsp:Transcript_9628/g.18315  ORF Transcript_9628/g.18315 Transcript_9628/m.18315 type:complete len:208 (-) Transcript_9628:27-650(-)
MTPSCSKVQARALVVVCGAHVAPGRRAAPESVQAPFRRGHQDVLDDGALASFAQHCAASDEVGDDVIFLPVQSAFQRSAVVAIFGVHVCTLSDEELHRFHLPFCRSKVQGSPAEVVPSVVVHLGLGHDAFHLGDIAISSGTDQAHVVDLELQLLCFVHKSPFACQVTHRFDHIRSRRSKVEQVIGSCDQSWHTHSAPPPEGLTGYEH